MSDFLLYSERMLQIGDYVPLCKQANSGRLVNKIKWQATAIHAIWEDSISIVEFSRRANISIGKAKELDEHFGRIFGTRIKEEIKKERKVITKIDKGEKALRSMFGL